MRLETLPRFIRPQSGCIDHRHTRLIIVAGVVVATVIVLVLIRRGSNGSPPFTFPHTLAGYYPSHAPPPHELPPLYSEYHNAELQFPQQDWSKTRPDEHEKFFFVAGHTRHLGWGNAIQEHLLNAYLAFRAGRTYVFDNYTWDDTKSYSVWDGKKIPAQIPYTALVRGPFVGDPFPDMDAPMAVTKDYFDHLCPEKVDLYRKDVHSGLPAGASAADIVDAWVDKLKSMDEACVQESRGARPEPIFSHDDIWGIRGTLQDIWPAFSSSPIITHYTWSSLVELGFDNNRELFFPMASLSEPLLSKTPFTTNAERYTQIPGLMVIHVRHGDYSEHCPRLADAAQDFITVNAFPELPDEFVVPPHVAGQLSSPENLEIYRRRCFPSIEEIVKKVMDVRSTPEAHGVNKMFIMTNAKAPFIGALKDALWSAGGWDMVASSRDMVLNWEQKYVPQAIDQLVAQRAQVFIGNGFSTLTSHAVMLRLANKFPPSSNRFW